MTQWHDLPGIALRDPHLTQGVSDEVGKVKAWFNASSVVFKGKRWMCYRTECKRWFLWSRINLVQLDSNFIPITGTNKVLEVHTRFDKWGAEDPRMFLFNGRMFVSYGDGYRMLLAELDENGNVIMETNLPGDQPDLNPPQDHDREKNWGFFEHDGRLMCQQDVAPTKTWEFDPKTWSVTDKMQVDWRWQSVYGMRVNGASPPVFHDGYLWRWVHTHRVEQLPEVRRAWWGKDLMKTGHRYYPFLMCFKPDAPYTPVAITEKPVFFSDWNALNIDAPTFYSVSYVGSSEREGDGWRLVLGENDCRIVTLHVPDKEALSSMVEIKTAPPRSIKSQKNNVLHFIWMQGEPPVADAKNIQTWRDLNPDWETMVWDDTSLTNIIATKAPAWNATWLALQQQRNAKPDDRALVAKASDLARLILLSIRWNGNQTWNAYADTDTTPHRALSDFLNDNTILGTGFGKTEKFSGMVTDRPWDSDQVDLIISQENLLTPRGDSVTNAVMLAKPGALAITAVLSAGQITRNRPTLEAFGPIMLRKTIEALKRTADGRRIEVLPFHYLVWNQTQMRTTRPEWTVCSHHNAFRWYQHGVKTTAAGATRSRNLV